MATNLQSRGWQRPTCGETVLLISEAGAVGTSVFTDTAKNKVITPVGSLVEWSSAETLFGKPTIYIGSSTHPLGGDQNGRSADGYLSIDDSDDFNLTTGQAFCFEFWFKKAVSDENSYSAFFGKSTTYNNGIEYGVYSNALNLTGNRNLIGFGFLNGITSGASSNLNSKWFHFAFTRDVSGVNRVFVDGTLVSTHTNGSSVNSANPFFIGAGAGASWSPTGHFAEIRFTKGAPVYTANFSPPGSFIA